MVLIDIADVLEDCISGTGIPLGISAPALIGRQNSHTTVRTIQIPRHSDADVGVQSQWLILGQHADRINA